MAIKKMAIKRHLINCNSEPNEEQNEHHLVKLPYSDNWMWSKRHRSQEVVLSESTNRRAYFHPNWSKGTAAVRGNHAINSCRHYWEIHVSHRVFGTSMMFGIGTADVRLHANKFINMLGEDENGWGFSHKGLLWHSGVAFQFTERFMENQPTRIGLLFDNINGTLTYFKDGKYLGVAFCGLNKVDKPLYPFVMSTAAKTEMTVAETRRDFPSLRDRCRGEILKYIKQKSDIKRLELPNTITDYLEVAYCDEQTLTPVDNFDMFKV